MNPTQTPDDDGLVWNTTPQSDADGLVWQVQPEHTDEDGLVWNSNPAPQPVDYQHYHDSVIARRPGSMPYSQAQEVLSSNKPGLTSYDDRFGITAPEDSTPASTTVSSVQDPQVNQSLPTTEETGRALARTGKSLVVGPVKAAEGLGTLLTNAAGINTGKPVAEQLNEKIDELTGGYSKPQNPTQEIVQEASDWLTGAGGLGVLSKASGIAKAAATPGAKVSESVVDSLTSVKSGADLAAAAGGGAAYKAAEQANPDDKFGQVGLSLVGVLGGYVGAKAVSPKAIESAKALAQSVSKDTEKFLGESSDKAAEALKADPAVLNKGQALMNGLPEEELKSVTDNLVEEPTASDILTSPEYSAGHSAMQKIMAGSSFAHNYINKYSIPIQIQRAQAKGGLEVGSLDVLEDAPITEVINRDATGRNLSYSMLGNVDSDGVHYWSKSGEFVHDTNVLPISRIWADAVKEGGTIEEFKQFKSAMNAMDDYINIDTKLASIDDSIASLRSSVSEDTAKVYTESDLLTKEAKPIEASIAEDKLAARSLKVEDHIDDLLAEKKELLSFKTFMPREDAQAIIDQYKDVPWATKALGRSNTLNRLRLDLAEDAGLISSKEKAAIQAAHPNYTPAYKVVEDLTGGGQEFRTPSSSSKGVKGRTGGTSEVMDVLEADIKAIAVMNSAIERNLVNKGLFEGWMTLPEDELSYIFREPKSDILAALDKLKTSPIKGLKASEVTPVEGNTITKTGNVSFYVDGKKLQLTVVNPDLVDSMNLAQTRQDSSVLFKMWRAINTFSRNSITQYDPTFGIRSLERESQDMTLFTKRYDGFFGSLVKGKMPKYIPFVSNVKALFTKELNPELYNKLNALMGHVENRALVGKDTAEMAKVITEQVAPEAGTLGSKAKSIVLKPIKMFDNATNGFLNRVDLAPRAIAYQLMKKGGATDDAAIRVAFEMGFNPMQQGMLASKTGVEANIYKFTRTIPFFTAFVNSTDRLIRLGYYNPGRLAKGLAFGIYPLYKGLQLQNQLYINPNTGKSYYDEGDPNIDRYTMRIYHPWSKSANDYIPFQLGWTIGRSALPVDKTLRYAANKIGIEGVYKLIAGEIDGKVETYLDNKIAQHSELKDSGVTGKDVIHAWMNYTHDLSSLALSVPAISPVVDLAQNKNFMGQRIIKSPQPPETEHLEYSDRTSPALVEYASQLSKLGFEVSPDATQYLIENYLHGVGRVSLDMADFIYSKFTKLPEKPQDLNFPGSRVLVGSLNTRVNTGVTSDYYRLQTEIMNIHQGYTNLRKRVDAGEIPDSELDRYEKENEIALDMYSTFKKANDTIRDIRDEISEITKSKTEGTKERELMGDPVKRRYIDNLLNEIDGIQKDAMDEVKNTKGGYDLYFKKNELSPPEELLYDITDKKIPAISEKLKGLLNKKKED